MNYYYDPVQNFKIIVKKKILCRDRNVIEAILFVG